MCNSPAMISPLYNPLVYEFNKSHWGVFTSLVICVCVGVCVGVCV